MTNQWVCSNEGIVKLMGDMSPIIAQLYALHIQTLTYLNVLRLFLHVMSHMHQF